MNDSLSDLGPSANRGKIGRKLAQGAKAPVKADHGLDWDAIREARGKRLDDEYARGVRNIDTLIHHELSDAQQRQLAQQAIAKPTPKRPPETHRKGGVSGKTRRVITDEMKREMKRLHTEEGLSAYAIGVKMGMANNTVVTHLRAQGVYTPHQTDTSSANGNKTVCKNGHSLTDEANVRVGVQRKGSKVHPIRTCLTCERERARKSYERNKEKKNKASVERRGYTYNG